MTSRASVFALLAISAASLAPTVAQEASQSPWSERLISTLPRDSSPNTVFWDSWVTLTPDASRIAYASRYRSGGYFREAIVFEGQRGEEFLYASRPVLSPDGTRLAYLAVPPSTGATPAFLVLGNHRVQIQIKDRLLGPTWIPVFSPDGRRLAFRAERPSGMYAIGAIDFNNLMDPATGQVQVVWGPEFADLDQPRWSPDSSTLAYAGARQNAWTLVVGTEPRATHKDITGVTFRPDGVLAYMASDGAKYSIVVGDEAGPAFDTVTEPSFRSDGTLVYSASNEQRHFVVVGSEKHEVPKAAEGAAASADGTRVMWWYREGNPPSRRMVVNGVAGRYFARVSKPVLDAESGAFVYTAEDNKGYYVVTTRGVSAKFGGVLWNPRISEDGAKAGFVALIDNQLWWKVVPLR